MQTSGYVDCTSGKTLITKSPASPATALLDNKAMSHVKSTEETPCKSAWERPKVNQLFRLFTSLCAH